MTSPTSLRLDRTGPTRSRLARVGLIALLTVTLFLPNALIASPAAAQSGGEQNPRNKKKNSDIPLEAPQSKPEPDQKPPEPDPQSGGGSLRSAKRRPPTKTQQPVEDDNGEPIRIETNVVNLEVVVYNKKTGAIYQNLKKDNFTVVEDGVKQEVTNFRPVEAPITLVMILEYSRIITPFRFEVIRPAATFLQRFVKPEDYVSIVAFDLRPKVLNDFTNNSAELASSVGVLIRGFPAFSESNLFDTMKFVLKGGKLDGEEYVGLEEVQGRTAILLVALGIDTFSKINFDEARKVVENAGVPVYSIGIGNFFYKLNDTRMSPEQNLTFLQAFNTLRAFSDSTGGKYFPVTFPGELPTTLESVNALMRNQYSLGYSPTNSSRLGKRRKIEVLVDVNGDGKPDNKDLNVQHRKTYVEPKDKK